MERPAASSAASPSSRPMLTIVLPIFNEELNLGPLLERIEHSLAPEAIAYRILAVDDGSTDGTAAIIDAFRSRLPLDLVRHASNQGLGSAIRTGLLAALRIAPANGVVVTMDADESHTPALIPRMLDAAAKGADVVIASRFQAGSGCHGVPPYRQLLSISASLVFRTLFPTPGVRDYTSGYRMYSVSALGRAVAQYGEALFEFDGFQCMVDLLLKLRAVGARFAEVPIILRYDLKRGQSKMRILRTAVQTMQLALRRRFGF
jgi:dolichol-phosphate mannosyltransferase